MIGDIDTRDPVYNENNGKSFFNVYEPNETETSWKDYLVKYHSKDIAGFKKDTFGNCLYRYPAITIDVITLMRYEIEQGRTWEQKTGCKPASLEDMRVLSRELHHNPKRVIEQIRIALDDLLQEYHHERVEVHFNNAMWPLAINQIRMDNIGKLYVINCTVSKVSQCRPVLIKAAWECARCKNVTYIPQEIGEAQVRPAFCCDTEKKFVGRIVSKESKYYDFQLIRLMETVDACEDGRQPQTVDAELLNDLAGNIVPGETLQVYGIPELVTKKDNRGYVKTNQEIHVNVVGINRQDRTEFVITSEDEAKITNLSMQPDIQEKIVNSIAPSIYGQRELKRAVALTLATGGQIRFADGTVQRGISHLLVVGDPSGGKSVILKAGNRLAVKSTFLSGKGASGVGLTAAAVKDSFDGGKWSLEAGAMPRCNGGFVFLDELDKLSDNDRQCLHGVLEDGFIEVEKAGMHARLRAETCLIAAANPVLGKFDDFQPIAKQINLPPALISRFDLILTYRDVADEKNDSLIAGYILAAHMGDDERIKPEIPEELLKKYFHYARTRINPTIKDKEIGDYLIKTYVDLRKSGPNMKITTRQLGGLIRLAKSSARLRLSPVIEKCDIEYVVELYIKALEESARGENGEVSINNLMGVTDAQTERIKAIIKYVQDNDGEDGIPLIRMVNDLVHDGYSRTSLYRDINELAYRRGMIIRLPNGNITSSL